MKECGRVSEKMGEGEKANRGEGVKKHGRESMRECDNE